MSSPPPEPGECDDPGRNGPSVDETLELLAEPLRREVIERCASSSERIRDVGELVDTIASAREEAGEESDRDQLLLALHHQHLPVLAEHGIISFDPRGGQLRYEPSELVERWLLRIETEKSE